MNLSLFSGLTLVNSCPPEVSDVDFKELLLSEVGE